MIMPTLDITIHNRPYGVQCGEGEELRLKRLASYVDARVREQAAAHGQIGDARLLVLTSLLIADELDDALAEIKRLQAGAGSASAGDDNGTAAMIDRMAERLEQLAAAVETA